MLSTAKTLLSLTALCSSIAGVAAAPQPAVTTMPLPMSILTPGAGKNTTTTTTKPIETVTMACWLPEGCASGLNTTSTELLVSATCSPDDCSLTWSTSAKVIVAAPTPGA